VEQKKSETASLGHIFLYARAKKAIKKQIIVFLDSFSLADKKTVKTNLEALRAVDRHRAGQPLRAERYKNLKYGLLAENFFFVERRITLY
jgi:hypothetical protein